MGTSMKTAVGSAEPPERDNLPVFSVAPARCPFTGIPQGMGCRGVCCRPDLHPLAVTVTVVGAAPAGFWSTLNTGSAARWPMS